VHNPLRAPERYFVQLRVVNATGKLEGLPDVLDEVIGPRRTVTAHDELFAGEVGPSPRFSCKVADVVRQTP
jgi:hypothetical protein